MASKHPVTNLRQFSVVKVATQQVLAVTQRFADLIKPNIEHYQQWILDNLEIGDSFNTTQLLTDSQRKTLALGRFLWEQIDNIKADNFAGPTLLFTGVLEEVTRITIYQIVPYLGDNRGRPLMQTLGTLGNCKGWGGNNWRILERSIMQGGHWEEKMPDGQTFPFSKWIDIMSLIAEIRNKAAHEADVDKDTFRKFTTRFFGSTMNGLGAFNGLLLAWK